MAYLKDFTTLTMAGTLAGGNEIWSCGLHLDSSVNSIPTEDWIDVYNARRLEYGEAVSSFFADADVMVPSDVKLKEVRLTHRGTDGKTIGEPIISPFNVSGGLNTTYAPQNALVNTLVSLKPRAPGRYNRFYLPVGLTTYGDSYKLNGTAQTNYATRLAEFITELNTIGLQDSPVNQAVVSVVSNAGTGWSETVSNVMIGQIIDTQQRRRNALVESYVTSPVSA